MILSMSCNNLRKQLFSPLRILICYFIIHINMITIIIILFVVLLFVASRVKNTIKYSQYPPGPISFPIIGSILALGSKPYEKLSWMKNKYGNIISIDFGNVRGIVLNDLDTIKNVFSLKELQGRPFSEAISIVRGIEPTGVAFSSGRTYDEQRSFVVRVLKNFGMGKNSVECLITDELQRLFSTFDQQLGIPMINKGLFQLTSVSVLWKLMTGEHGKAEDPEFINLMLEIAKGGRGFNIFTLFFPQISKVFPNFSGWNDFLTGLSEMNKYAGKSINSSKKAFNSNLEPNNLIEAYLLKIESTQDENSTFFGKTGDKNLHSVISDFLGAGTETVSSSLTWLLSVLVYYPNVQDKIHQEIDQVIGRNRLPSLQDRSKLPYLESVIFEILRFSALLPLGLPHVTSEDVKIDKYVIPKGTVVIANAYDALQDPVRWNEPHVFKPERFLNQDESAIDRNIARDVDIVFGHGKRICPGEKLAKNQLFIFITGLCQRYTFLRDPLSHYDQKIESEFGISLLPTPHFLVIQRR